MVTTAGKPSGTAATANEIASIKSSAIVLAIKSEPICLIAKALSIWMPNINKTITIVKIPRNLDNSASFFCNGVCSSSASDNMLAILPVSVSLPVLITIPSPRP